MTIRGGAEYGLGIYVTGVDESSAAHIAGLQVGDEIVSVQDIDLRQSGHDEAVDLLQSHAHLSLVVRSGGKVPHSTLLSPYHPTSPTAGWTPRFSRKSSPRLSRKGSRDPVAEEPDSRQVLRSKRARQLLGEGQRRALAYCLTDYESGAMDLGDFVEALLQQLDTPDKYTLMAEIRNLIRVEELEPFDELIYRRELKTKESKKLAVEIHAEQVADDDDRLSPPPWPNLRRPPKKEDSHHHLTVPKDPHADTPPSEESGADEGGLYRKGSRGSGGGGSPRRRRRRRSPESARRTTFRRHSSGGEAEDSRRRQQQRREDRRWSIGSERHQRHHWDAALLSPLPRLTPQQVPHSRVRRHRSLPDPHAIQARKKQQQMERMQQHRSASVRIPSGHRTVPVGGGRFRVTVKKTRPMLGIAIEGGCDTTQPLPRIISIHRSGSAFECGGLRVGHLILEVDGTSTTRRCHREVAQRIARAFYGADGEQVEFLVADTVRNPEQEIRRTSIRVFE